MLIWLNILTFVIAFLVTYLTTKLARKFALMDLPVGRSLHKIPTPRGGGLGIVFAFVLSSCLAWAASAISNEALVIVSLGGLMAGLGFWDDRKGLSAKFRLVMQFAIAALLLTWFLNYFDLQSWRRVFELETPAVLNAVLLAFLIVWFTNLYNFMDGSDGIACTQALSVFFALGTLALRQEDLELCLLCWLLASACGGFLPNNWQPAKIFMGDVGSLFLGFTSAAILIWSGLKGAVPFAAALCLHGAFIVDATITLLVRLSRGLRPHEAHRTHTYQRWVQSGRSHAYVARVYGTVNLLWLFPCAFVISSITFPLVQWVVLILVWSPLVMFALRMRAGHDFMPEAKPTAAAATTSTL